MPRLLVKSVKASHVIKEALGYSENLAGDVWGIADSNIGGDKTIADYIKGKLPKTGTILIVRTPIDGYQCVVSNTPSFDFLKLTNWLESNVGFKDLTSGIVSKSVSLGQNVVIESDVEIGEGTAIEHNVVIHAGTKIGRNCIVRSGSVIGGQGYGFLSDDQGKQYRQLFFGGVILEDNVEVGYNCSLVSGSVESTVLSAGVKLDNLVHIAHDCHIVKYSTITAGVSFCGYVNVGRSVRMAPNSTVLQRLSIGDNAIIGLGAVVLRDVAPDSIIIGNPGKHLKKRG